MSKKATNISKYLAKIEEWKTFVRTASKSCPGDFKAPLLLVPSSYNRCFLMCGGPTAVQPEVEGG